MRDALLAALVAAWLAGCGLHPAPHEQRFTGALDGCGASPATLTRVGGDVAFAPSDGVLVLHGAVAADGAVTAALNTQPPGKPPYLLTLRGRLDAESAVLTYATPGCVAHGTLRRVHPALL